MKLCITLRSKLALALTLSCILSMLFVGIVAMMISERQFKNIADQRSLSSFTEHVLEYYSQYGFSGDTEIPIHRWMLLRGSGMESSEITPNSIKFGFKKPPKIGERPRKRPTRAYGESPTQSKPYPKLRNQQPIQEGFVKKPAHPPNGPFDRFAHPNQNQLHKDPYILVSADYRVLLGAGLYPADTILSLDKINKYSEIEYQGEIIGYAFPKSVIGLSKQEEHYLDTLFRSLVLAALPAIVFALILALFLSRHFSKKINKLSIAISQLGEGNFQNITPVDSNKKSGDELELLNTTFNQMAHQLSVSNEKITAQALALTELSNRDELTGLYNRRYANVQATEHLARSLRYNRPMGIAMCDIDNFKAINDTYLHETGDDVLKIISKVFVSSLRKIDIVARYGGEEFVIIFPETTQENAIILADKLRESIAKYDWNSVAQGLIVTISIGISSNDSLTKFEEILSTADKNLYSAKNSGKNKVVA